jgi:hypothetical protein
VTIGELIAALSESGDNVNWTAVLHSLFYFGAGWLFLEVCSTLHRVQEALSTYVKRQKGMSWIESKGEWR